MEPMKELGNFKLLCAIPPGKHYYFFSFDGKSFVAEDLPIVNKHF